jgi:hypothetical protein
MSYGMDIQIVTPYRVSQLQRYGVTVHSNVTSVYTPECVGLKPLSIAVIAGSVRVNGMDVFVMCFAGSNLCRELIIRP